MIGLSRRVRIFAHTRAVDRREQYDGPYALVVSELNADPLSVDLRNGDGHRAAAPEV